VGWTISMIADVVIDQIGGREHIAIHTKHSHFPRTEKQADSVSDECVGGQRAQFT
jgi:hypothetical protein